MKRFAVCMTILAVLGITWSAEARRGTPPLALMNNTDFTGMEQLFMHPPELERVFVKDREVAGPVRVAEKLIVGKAMNEVGTWTTLKDGSQHWQLRVTSPGAYFLSFHLSDFELPEGSELHFISVERNFYDGPYSAGHNNASRWLSSPMIPDDSALITLWIPEGTERPNLRLEEVSWGYKNFRNILSTPYRDGRPVLSTKNARMISDKACIDFRCSPDAAQWEAQHRSVAEAYDGAYICSGAMLNSTDNNCTEFHYQTAKHCFTKGDAKNLVFYYNYENSACGTNDAGINETTTGSTHLMSHPSSDFYLVKLTELPPAGYFVSQSGFDATGAVPQSGTTMGFPNDVPMVIAHTYSPLRDGDNTGWGTDHWRVDSWDIGGTDSGSSGGALWDQNGRSVGQLHGGTGTCGDGGWDEYGKLSVAWAAGAAQHLDPGNTGNLTTDLIDCFGGTPPPPPPTCELGQSGDACSSDADCCSNDCRTKGRWANTCN